MCGIIGVFGDERQSVRDNLNFLDHRGPDFSDVYSDNDLSIGHTRLSIIDLSSLGNQPMICEEKRYVIVFNGEIYNFKEIRQELELKGYSFKSSSDTEVLLSLYKDCKEKALEKIEGIFAFAIWDIQTKELFIARDRFGVKPLYYFNEDKKFGFASEIKALSGLIQSKEIDYDSIRKYLNFIWCPGTGTPFAKIKRLEPGCSLTIKNKKIIKHKQWFKLPILRSSLRNLNKSESIQGVVKYLRSAIHKQMISDAPVGAFLSGGLDSSSIVLFAKELNPDIRCFTIDTGQHSESDRFSSDLPYAMEVAKHLNVDLDIVKLSSETFVDDFEKMIYMLDEPLADPAALNVYYISKLAREKGIKVLLSGTGGDDIFTGYRRHRAINFDKYLDFFPKGFMENLKNLSNKIEMTGPFKRRLKKYLSSLDPDPNKRLVNFFRWSDDELITSILSDNISTSLTGVDPDVDFINFLKSSECELNKLNKMLALEQRFFLTDHNLCYNDKMSMAAGVEIRVPYLDTDLVSFANKIPDRYKQNRHTSKLVLKKAMEPYLPRKIIYRPKTGFNLPLRTWIKNDMRDYVHELLSKENINNRGIFSYPEVSKLINYNEKNIIDASYTILSIMSVEIWLKKFID